MNAATNERMVLIPAGEFMMGKDLANPGDFSPAHRVKVDAFYMDRHEVTNGEYFSYCEVTGYKLPEFWDSKMFRCGKDYLDYPVIGINWYDANRYAEWAGKRLPTEAEWEYAARGGLIDNEYPNGNSWNKERAEQGPGNWENLIHEVESDEPNGYGLYEMAGNVWEWNWDIYSEIYYQQRVSKNPPGPEKGTNRVIRGGSWHSGAMCKKVYYRKGLPENWSDFAVGFRCAKDANSGH
jgi:iron(II)-dependent oxidoreductase